MLNIKFIGKGFEKIGWWVMIDNFWSAVLRSGWFELGIAVVHFLPFTVIIFFFTYGVYLKYRESQIEAVTILDAGIEGVTMTSEKYKLIFEPAKDIKFENLKKLMDIILDVADASGDNFDKDKMKSDLDKKLLETLSENQESSQINIFDEPFSPRPKGHFWRIILKRISLGRFNYNLEFRLAKRNVLKTLKDLALNAITSNVRNGTHIDKLQLDVPDTIKMSMKQDCYARKQFPKFEPYEISLTKKLQFSEILKRRHEKRRQIQVKKESCDSGMSFKAEN